MHRNPQFGPWNRSGRVYWWLHTCEPKPRYDRGSVRAAISHEWNGLSSAYLFIGTFMIAIE